MATNNNLRQPIVTVCGHVDHGKTSILDRIRGTKIAEGEAGGITQKISFTEMPKDIIKQRAGEILEKFKIPLEIPGFLFIDTPGHAAFTNLRKRGGSLADVAVLVIDINEGIKPQTAEVLQILRANKTPFIIALNKIDNISGWRTSESKIFYEGIEKQGMLVSQNFEEKLLTLIGALNAYKFDADIYTKISDFTKKIAMIPCSARTGEGISEILAVLCALSQKFLKERIYLKEDGKGVVLEVKKEKSMNYLECILYDGYIHLGDEIIISNIGTPILTKIRSMEKALPLSKGYESKERVIAAAGIRIQTNSKEEVLSGMRFQVIKNDLKELEQEFKEELEQEIKTDDSGIVVKADSLGSLEAILFLLKQKQIKVIRAEIGNITKKDVYQAGVNPEDERVIIGFNSVPEKELETTGVKIISNPIVYKIIEDFEEWKEKKIKELERKKLGELANLAKITILPYVFRNSNPAIFGVRIEGGVLKKNIELINRIGEKIGRIKTIQEDQLSFNEAEVGKEVAILVPGVNFERQLEKGECLYSNLSEFHFRKFKENKDLLNSSEIKVLQEIAEIKRKTDLTWGI